jgi:hypothetical protein
MGCNPLSPDAQKVLVRVPLVNPGAFRWILANDPRDEIADEVSFLHAPTTTRGGNGALIHSGTERLAQNPPLGKYHYVSIEVDGEIAYDIGEAPVFEPLLQPPVVQSTGNRSSLLKARITLDMGTGKQRKFDFDIGAGVEFSVAAYAISKIEVLIPDPRVSIPAEPSPEGDTGPFQLATVLTTTAYFTQQSARQKNPLTYTVPAALNVNLTEFFVPRVADSVAIEAGAFEGTSIVVDFLYVPPGFREASYTAPASYYVLDSAQPPTATSRIPRTLIPGNANAMRVRRTGGPAGSQVVNLIQVLNV